MNDLISRQVAIDALGERPMVWDTGDDYSLGERNQYDMNKLAIETVPAADAVPVVRCKDCIFWDTFPSSSAAPAYHKCKGLHIHTVLNDYCSRGVNINEKI